MYKGTTIDGNALTAPSTSPNYPNHFRLNDPDPGFWKDAGDYSGWPSNYKINPIITTGHTFPNTPINGQEFKELKLLIFGLQREIEELKKHLGCK